MKNTLLQILKDAKHTLKDISHKADFERAYYDFLGRSGKIAKLSKQMKDIAVEERKELGALFNTVKHEVEELFTEKEKAFKPKTSIQSVLDYTLPGIRPEKGSVHPINQFIDKTVSIFTAMGYEVVEGNEVETQEINFDLLNFPKDHPARDIQDTFFIDNKERWILRTHTSNMQIRAMYDRKPPVRIVSPGRVFRNEATDASHEAQFYQFECFAVDKGIRLTDLKGTLELFLQRLYGDVAVRMRPHYYPFVEPGFDVDMSCLICKGEGCRVCKKTGWLEMLGSGMIHPTVLKNMGVDPNTYSGFAFGMGIDRLMMFYYGIDDVRHSYQGDIRFLKQF